MCLDLFTDMYKEKKKVCSKNSLPRIDPIIDKLFLFPVIHCYM